MIRRALELHQAVQRASRRILDRLLAWRRRARDRAALAAAVQRACGCDASTTAERARRTAAAVQAHNAGRMPERAQRLRCGPVQVPCDPQD